MCDPISDDPKDVSLPALESSMCDPIEMQANEDDDPIEAAANEVCDAIVKAAAKTFAQAASL